MNNTFFEIDYNHYFLEPLRIDKPDFYPIQASEISKGIDELFDNEIVKKYHPEKIQTAQLTLITTQIGYKNRTSSTHFIFDSNFERFIGIIELLSPKGIKEMYPNISPIFEKYEEYHNTWIIEYWLNENYWERGIMSFFVPTFCDLVFKNTDARSITALCHTLNIPSQRLALKCGFIKVGTFSETQDHYFLTPENLKTFY